MACGLPVIAAARMAAEGRSFEEIQHLVGQMLQGMALYLAVPDLSYLRRGKKISGLKSLVGINTGPASTGVMYCKHPRGH